MFMHVCVVCVKKEVGRRRWKGMGAAGDKQKLSLKESKLIVQIR